MSQEDWQETRLHAPNPNATAPTHYSVWCLAILLLTVLFVVWLGRSNRRVTLPQRSSAKRRQPKQRHVLDLTSILVDHVQEQEDLIAAGTRAFVPQLIGSRKDGQNLLNSDYLRQLRDYLSGIEVVSDVHLLFNSNDHGARLATMMARSQSEALNCSAQLLLVQDTNYHVFGLFCHGGWHDEPVYFGQDTTFVFQMAPQLRVFRWSKANTCFMIATPTYIAAGGGDNFALWLDSNLKRGSSKPCMTFNSPTLASSGDFDVMAVELWGFFPR